MKNHYAKLKDKEKPHNPNYGKKHFIEVPFMSAIVGFTGSGKSNCLMNLIDAMKGTFQKFVFCTMSFDTDPLYVDLQARLQKLAHKHKLEDDAYIQVYDGGEVPDPEDLEAIPTLVVFDDLQGERKASEQASKFYKYGRKMGFSCVYLGQSYTDIPIFIRKQLKYLFIKRVNQIDDLKRILSRYGLGQYRGRLEEIYKYCTDDFKNVMLLDLLKSKIYRNFTELIQ